MPTYNLAMLLIAPLIDLPAEVTLALRIALVAFMLAACVFIIIVVMLQSGNTDGVSAITGSSDTDTFYGKNKAKRTEHRLKTLTVVSAILIAVSSIAFFLLAL